MSNENDRLAKDIAVPIEHKEVVRLGRDKDGKETVTHETVNATVAKMSDEIRSDVPTGLATIPHDADLHALARRTAGDLLKNEAEFHCMACGWSKSLKFDAEEMEALDNEINSYTGPCPGCNCMTLVPKDKLWGGDFPSMAKLADKSKRHDARIQAEEMASVLKETVADVMTPKMPGAPAEEAEAAAPAREDLPEEADPSKLTPR